MIGLYTNIQTYPYKTLMIVFVKPLLEKLCHENKNIILLGEFNIYLLRYNSNTQTGEFLNQVYFGFLFPQITIPTKMTLRSKTLIDNIFTNTVNKFSISNNLLCSISDYLAQFLIYLDHKVIFDNHQKPQCRRNYKGMVKSNFVQDLENINLIGTLYTNQDNAETEVEQLLIFINSLIDKHVPQRKITKQEVKTKSKPWLTTVILTSIKKYQQNL